MTKQRNIPASVRQRLLNLSRERGEDFQALLTRFALERFLYRLSQSEHSDQFILKGALLFSLWSDDPHRATWDIDLLGHGPSTPDRLQEVFRQVCQVRCDDDGLTYLADSVTCFRIKEDQQYEGVRVQLRSQLGKARMRVQVDVGFGDTVVPPPRTVDYPSLLALSPARLRAYPPETVVAEKFQAMVLKAMANSRMKDFNDVWRIAQDFALEGPRLSRAIKATF